MELLGVCGALLLAGGILILLKLVRDERRERQRDESGAVDWDDWTK